MEMQIGQIYQNITGERFEIISASKTWLCLKTKNLNTGEIIPFRFYRASGKYLDSRKNKITHLGNFVSQNVYNNK